MQQTLVLITCLLVASAAADYGWQPRLEYRFAVEGRTVAGIPSLKQQYSGIHFMGTLRVQAQRAEVLLMKLQNMTFTKLQTQLPRGWWQELPDLEQEYQVFPITNSPFIARLQKGVVERLVVGGNLPTWEVNFLQAIVSHLQFDLSGSHSLRNNGVRDNKAQGRGGDEPDIFTVMENSIVGRCEVLYEIAPMSKLNMIYKNPDWLDLCGKKRGFLEITKTRNYSSCEEIAESHFGLPPSLKCSPGGNECGSFWNRASVSRSIGCGDRKDLILLSTVSSSRVMAALRMQPEDTTRGHPGSQATVGTYLNLTLLSSRPFGTRQFGQPSNPIFIDGIRYQLNSSTSEQAMERPNSSNKKNEDKRPRRFRRRIRKRTKSHHQNSSPDEDEAVQESEHEKESHEEESEREHSRDKKKEHKKDHKKDTKKEHERKRERESSSQSGSSSEEVHDRHQDRNVDDDDLSESLLLPFSPFTLAHREGEARACLVQQIKELINDIANDLEVPKTIPEKMTIEKIQVVVKICRTLNYSELSRAVGSIMDIQSRETKTVSTERKLLRDVVTMCGSSPAFRVIKSWIEQRKVRGEAAAELIAALPSYVLAPSATLVKEFFELIKSSAVNEDQQLKISSVLAFSHLIRIACVSKSARMSRFSESFKSCNADNVAQFLPYFASRMRSEPSLRRVYATAIGNTGADEAMPILVAAARDSNASPYQRASAILAARYIVFKDPESSMYTLLSFYHNSGYPTAVRVAALSLLFFTKPPLIVWQRIAISTWYEPNEAIKAYVWSTLNNMASTQDSFYKEMSAHALSVLPLARPVSLGPHRPYNLVRTAVTSGLHEVVLEQLSWSADLSAANLYYRQTQRLGGFSRLQFEADLWLADADSFMTSLSDMMTKHHEKTEKTRPPIRELPRSTHWIRETLKIAARELPKSEGHLAFRLGALHERMFPFDHKMISAFEKGGRRVIDQLRNSKPMLYQKMGETGFWLGAPNELGLPMALQVNVPWTVRVKGELNVPRVSSNSIAADISAMYTSQLTTELSVYTPFDCFQYVAGAHSQTFIQVPSFRVAARWNNEPSTQVELSFTSFADDDQSLFFSQTSRPFTSQHDVISLTPISLSKTTVTVNVAPEVHSELLPGSPVSLHYSSEAPYHRWSPEPNWILSYPALWPGLEAATLHLHVSQPPPIRMMLTLGHAKAEDGVITILSEADFSDATEAPPTSTTPYYSTTPAYSSTTDNPESTSDMWSTTTSKYNDEQTEMSTIMEEILNTNLTILSSNVEDPVGNFNASSLNLLSIDGNSSRSNYLLNQVLSGMNSGQALVLGAAIGVNHSSTTRYQVYWTLGAGRARRFHRMGLFIIDEEDKWQTGFTSTLQTPAVPLLRLRSMLDANLTSHLFVDYKYSTKILEDVVSMKGSMLRTESQTNFVRNHSMTMNCLEHNWDVQPECRQMALEAGYLDRYNLTINYNANAERYGAPVQHYFGLIKHALFPYLAEEDTPASSTSDLPKHRVRLVAELSPESQTAALWMRTPNGDAELSGMPINPLVMQVLRVNPIVGFLPRFQDPSFCSLEADHMVTFDGSRYTYQLGNCWHVLAKDCSGRSRVVVLARHLSNRTEVEINIDNHKIVRLLPMGEALVNGRSVDLSGEQLAETYDQVGTRLLELTSSADHTLRLQLPAHGMTILHVNDTVLIEAKTSLRGHLCGMCGDFNGELEDDFRAPNGNTIYKAYDFARSYALPSGSCHMPR